MRFKTFNLLLLFILGLLAYLIWNFFVPFNPTSELEVWFKINKGESLVSIAQRLKEKEVIRDPFSFLVYAGITGNLRKIQAGVYKLSPKMSIAKIVKDLSEGKVAKIKITIIEGWNLRDIAEYLESLGLFSKEEFYKVSGFPPSEEKSFYQIPEDLIKKFHFLKEIPLGLPLEGFLMPDTYFVKAESSPQQIVEIMLSNFEKKVLKNPEIKSQIKSSNLSLFEIITLASLLEKEVKTFKDKQIVAGILLKRLEAKMPLQVDATLTYILNKKSIKISIQETKIDHPYNTYKYLGLPPGPIANPGIESIKAVLNPIYTDYWYYLSKKDGSTIFSKTFREHLENKKKYLK